MDHEHEIATLKQQLADTDRHVQSSADLREKIAAHEVAKAAAAAREAREADEALAAVTDAARAARRAEVPALKIALAATAQQLAAADANAREHLQTAVEACRAIHTERERLVQQHDHLRGKLSAHQEWNARVNPLGFAAFLRGHFAHVVE